MNTSSDPVVARTIDELSRQVLTGIITAPAHIAHQAINALETADFPNWIHAKIFDTLPRLDFPTTPAPGSVITQINAQLLESGDLEDHDNGLRAAVLDLATNAGHPQQLPTFTNELIVWRFRTAVASWGADLSDHAGTCPLNDLQQRLTGIEELRRLYARIQSPKRLTPVQGVA